MDGVKTNFGIFGIELILLLVVVFCDPIFAEQRHIKSHRPTLEKIFPFWNKPKDYRNDEYYLYKKYMSGNDRRVSREYKDQWHYHDSQIPYYVLDWRYEHFEGGSLSNIGHAPSEVDTRNRFANRVVVQRAIQMVRAYFAHPARAKNSGRRFRNAEGVASKLKNFRISLPSPEKTGQISLTHNFFEDVSRLAYRMGRFEAVLSQYDFTGILNSSSASLPTRWKMDISTQLNAQLPQTSFGYEIGTNQLETRLSKPLSSDMTTEIISRHNLRNSNFWGYELRVHYRF